MNIEYSIGYDIPQPKSSLFEWLSFEGVIDYKVCDFGILGTNLLPLFYSNNLLENEDLIWEIKEVIKTILNDSLKPC